MAIETASALLTTGAGASPAIGAIDRSALTYSALAELIVRTRSTLHALSIGRQDRVAIVLPNGPEMAAAFLGVLGTATAAPLNPAFKQEEFAFYLADLRVSALVVLAGWTTPSTAAAHALEIPVLELVPGDAGAGDFSLRLLSGVVTGKSGGDTSEPTADDVALLLHTSGTTARPKIVPLLHRNLVASAQNIARTLALDEDDVCLNIMPLFHIHGLLAAVLASLAAGGTVVCTPGLNAFRFFSWFDAVRPTWYTAVPTMHQTLLELAPRHRAVIEKGRLRFVRSSSASLPPQVMADLESTLGVPVIEAYGMTEAAHQMASNPLPPGRRMAGIVGRAAGPEIGIMDKAGSLLPVGEPGEVVIRGANVTPGYENNPSANASAFTNGWFRTGDEGVLDRDGYLQLTGRIKEIINRAGEKVSPLEVDNAIMEHPGVQQVVTFGMPSKIFGEDVAVAVVLREGSDLDAKGLRQFLTDRLADFKIPREVVFLNDIPKGPTGKLQRIGLAERLGVSG